MLCWCQSTTLSLQAGVDKGCRGDWRFIGLFYWWVSGCIESQVVSALSIVGNHHGPPRRAVNRLFTRVDSSDPGPGFRGGKFG